MTHHVESVGLRACEFESHQSHFGRCSAPLSVKQWALFCAVDAERFDSFISHSKDYLYAATTAGAEAGFISLRVRFDF
jgi:hypothetical protein